MDANISGFPYPQITWMRDNSTIWPEPLKKRPERSIKKKKKEKEKEEKMEVDAEKKEADAKKEEDKEAKEEDKEKEKEKEKEVEDPEEPEEAYHPTLNERLTIESKRKGESFIIVNNTIRGDHGIFTIKVENDHGFASASCEVNVLGKYTTLQCDINTLQETCKTFPTLNNNNNNTNYGMLHLYSFFFRYSWTSSQFQI